ncbi:MAG: hypothetical protein KAG34_03005 [Cocleimonas sp.]|nr:hypothetical protein [Cocleimonas sp.]
MMIKAITTLMLVSFMLFNTTTSDAETNTLRPTSEVDYIAEEPLSVKQSKHIIADIVNSADLKANKKSTTWRIKEFDFETSNETPEWIETLSLIFASIIEYALWILLFIAILMLYVTRHHWLHLFSVEKDEKEAYQAPDVLFGMDVREESLPDDLVGEVKLLWQQQKARESLSLLYRGALVHLINQEKLPLENSHTEGDILKLSKKTVADNKQDYLSQLTAQWQLIAYAHRNPEDEAMEWLFRHWQQDFADVSAAEVTS